LSSTLQQMQSKPNRGMNNSSTPRRDPISSIDAMFPYEMGAPLVSDRDWFLPLPNFPFSEKFFFSCEFLFF
jgi:hypothetical protein